MWSDKKEDIEAMFSDCDTGGAIRKYQWHLSLKDDGDVWWEVILPVWSSNDYVAKWVIAKAQLVLAMGNSHIHVEDGQIRLCLFISVCDPD